MLNWRSFRLSREIVLRMCADAVLLNVSLILALAVRYFYLVAFETLEGGYTYNQMFWTYVTFFSKRSWLLTTICLIVFLMSGFYTYSRAYQGRYKALMIFQAASLGYLIFSFFSYLLGLMPQLPRGAVLLAWLISVALLMAARGWSMIWRDVMRTELQHGRHAQTREVRNVLVIGGAGYIGSGLLPKLLDKGYKVRLLDLLLYGTEPIEGLLTHPRLEVVRADFRAIDKVVEAMRGMDAVIHLGAIVGDPACALDEELTIEVNLMATRMIAEVAKGSGVNRFIFASTCSVYGASDELLDERSALNPVSLYARSKIASERVLKRMADETFAPTLLRFGTIYGLSGRTRFDLVVNLLTAKAIVEGRITVSGGDQWRPFVHVDDAALAVFKALEAPLPAVHNKVFNIGSNDQNYTISQVGEAIQRLVPTAELIDIEFDGDRRNYRVNFSKVQQTLGFVPQWTLEQGINQVVEAIRDGKVVDYTNAKYSNVKFLSEEGMTRNINRQNGWAYELMNEPMVTHVEGWPN